MIKRRVLDGDFVEDDENDEIYLEKLKTSEIARFKDLESESAKRKQMKKPRANASIPMASSNSEDFAKKKKANRSAKLKQCKLDARREQWLSLVKNKGNCKEESNGEGIHRGSSVLMENESIRAIEISQERYRRIMGMDRNCIITVIPNHLHRAALLATPAVSWAVVIPEPILL